MEENKEPTPEKPKLSFSDYFLEEKKKYSDKIESQKAPIMAALKEAKIKSIKITYEGSGDSGNVQLDEITMCDNPVIEKRYDEEKQKTVLKNVETKEIVDFGITVELLEDKAKWDKEKEAWDITATLVTKTLEDAVVDLGYTVLEMDYGGWEINDGASGEIVITPEDNKIVVSHTDPKSEY